MTGWDNRYQLASVIDRDHETHVTADVSLHDPCAWVDGCPVVVELFGQDCTDFEEVAFFGSWLDHGEVCVDLEVDVFAEVLVT
jgi:hypothetical protein